MLPLQSKESIMLKFKDLVPSMPRKPRLGIFLILTILLHGWAGQSECFYLAWYNNVKFRLSCLCMKNISDTHVYLKAYPILLLFRWSIRPWASDEGEIKTKSTQLQHCKRIPMPWAFNTLIFPFGPEDNVPFAFDYWIELKHRMLFCI